MMADSVEAASHTLSNPSPELFQGMIDRLVDDVLADNQLDECDITIRDIRLVKESFQNVLIGRHHRRIEYPGYAFTAAQKDSTEAQLPAQDNLRPRAF